MKPTISKTLVIALALLTNAMAVWAQSLTIDSTTIRVTTNATSATVTFTTSIPATGGITYSGPGVSWTSPGDSGGTQNHSITVTGLQTNGVYSYYTFAYVGSLGLPHGPGGTFTPSGDSTNPTPLTISNVTFSNVTATAAVIAFQTSVAANGSVLVSGPGISGQETVPDNLGAVTSHSVMVTGLQSSSAYTFSAYAAEGSQNATSNPSQFATLSAPSNGTLGIYNSQITSITSNSVVMTFSSGIPAYGGVDYIAQGTNTWMSVGDPGGYVLQTNHSITISGLQPGTTYQYNDFAFVGSQDTPAVFATFSTPSANVPSPPSTSTSQNVLLVGRWDESDPAGPRATWSGSGVKANVLCGSFGCTSVTATIYTQNILDNQNPYYVAIVDGGTPTRLQGQVGNYTYSIASGISSGSHTVEIYREMEGWNGITQFLGFTIDGGQLTTPPSAANIHMEAIGDSILAGYGNVGTSPCSGVNTNNESSYMSWGAVLARMIGADYVGIAQTGNGVYRNNLGYINSATTPTMVALYTETLTYGNGVGLNQYPYPEVGQTATPMDIVTVNLGTNDTAQGMPTASQFEGAYQTLIGEIRAIHGPNAKIVLTIGPMLYGSQLTTIRGYLTDLVNYYNSLGDNNVYQVVVDGQNPSNGVGCDSHPNTAEDLRMAQQIAGQLTPILGIPIVNTDPNPLISW